LSSDNSGERELGVARDDVDGGLPIVGWFGRGVFDCSMDQLRFLRWEKHVDVVRVNSGSEVLIAVGDGGPSRLKLPSVDLESRNVRVGTDGCSLPADVTIIGALVGSEPVERASIVGTLGVRRLESEAIEARPEAKPNNPETWPLYTSADWLDMRIVCLG